MRRFIGKYKAILILLLFVATGTLGYMLAKASPEISKQATVNAQSSTEKVGEKAEIETRYCYDLCGHRQTKTEQVKPEYIGATKEQIYNIFEGYSIKEFSADSVVLEKHFDMYCEKHILLYLDGNMALAYQCEKGTDQPRQVWQAEIDVSMLLEEEKKALEKGKVFNGLEEAKAYVQKPD